MLLNSDLDDTLAKKGIGREEGHHPPGFSAAKRESNRIQEDDEFVFFHHYS